MLSTDLMSSALTTIKKKKKGCSFIHTQCNQNSLGGKSLVSITFTQGKKLEKLKLHSQLRESISAFYFPHLEKPIHVSLHVGNRHLLHDDVRDSAFK